MFLNNHATVRSNHERGSRGSCTNVALSTAMLHSSTEQYFLQLPRLKIAASG